MNSKSAIAVEISKNKKLGKYCSATYVSQATCPPTCKFRGHGCYAEYGHSRYILNRLNRSKVSNPIEVTKAEAEAIGKLSGHFPLRLHVVGDCYDTQSASMLTEACLEYRAKHGQPVWTYTQNHDIPREAWGSISVLRSCTNRKQVAESIDAGFAAALVVPDFDTEGIPCPALLDKSIHCVDCRRCINATNEVILFKVHGTGKNQAKEVLG